MLILAIVAITFMSVYSLDALLTRQHAKRQMKKRGLFRHER